VNLLYVGTLPPHPGGSAVSCGQLLGRLARLGHRIRAIGPMTAEARQEGDRFASGHPAIEVHRFRVPYFEVDVRRVPSEAHRRDEEEQIEGHLDRLMDLEAPDLVLLGRETFAWVAARLAARGTVPCALRIAGPLLRALATGTYPAAHAGRYVDGCRAADLLIVQGPHMRELAERLGVRRVAVVPNSVDLAQFVPRPSPAPLRAALGIGADDVVVVHASNLKTIKRPLDVVRAAARALPVDPRLVFVIVGDGQCRAEMEDICRRTGVAHRFRFVGWVDYARMPDYLALADVVVMPSEFEQQARVYLETQAAGRLLLASAVQSAREVVEDGHTGLLHRPGDVGDLADKLVRAAADPIARARVGRQARAHVARHSVARMAPRFAAVLEAVAASAARAGTPVGPTA
jgi:glycosyltransferase involved in cell wall biosynthesis